MIIKNGRTQLFFLVMCFFCITLITLFGLRNSIKNLNKELYKTKNEIVKLQNLVKTLESDLTNLSKLKRISKLAKKKLGLEKTDSKQVKKFSDL